MLARDIATTLLAVGAVLLLLSLRPLLSRGMDWRARLALTEKGEKG